ncbi:MAG: protoporphyrinogen oxidase [Phycisphaerales bacterium]|nr:MAG: protoporphyrinogen oxidase [Phycisphaerales bacterium]
MMNQPFKDVVVVGGGISGLTVAYYLHKAGVDVRLLEAGDEVGGCTRTERRDGFLLEKGPFNVLVREPVFEDLIVGVSDKVGVVSASKAAKKRFIYRHGRLHCVPTNPISLATTQMLTLRGRMSLIAGLIRSPKAGEEEETIEQAAVRRFGRDVADTMISSIISGIFAGNTRKLSLRACFPTVARVDREAGSLIAYGLAKAFGSKRGKGKKRRRKYKGLVSLDGGLGALTGELGRSLDSSLQTNYRVETLAKIDGGYEITCKNGDASPDTIRCRRLVIASPTSEAARLLTPLLPRASGIISSIESSSLVVINLGYRQTDVGHPLDGFGFLVPHHETQFPLMGVLWADSIFPQHAPEGHRLIRVFIGGANNPEAVGRSDDDLLETSRNAVRDLLQVKGEPVLTDICRYQAAIPQYYPGHVEKIAKLRAEIATQPGLYLTGNYLGGVSLSDCVRISTELADELIGANGAGGVSESQADGETVVLAAR